MGLRSFKITAAGAVLPEVPPAEDQAKEDQYTEKARQLDLEERRLKNRGIEEQNHSHAEVNMNLRADRRMRIRLMFRVEKTFRCSLLGLSILILLQATRGFSQFFHLSDKVVITILGSTAVSVIGIFLAVVQSLFPKK